MEPDTKWLIGIAVGFFSTFGSVLILAFRNLAAKISDGNKDIYARIDDESKESNHRIDDVKMRYARRDDMDGHIQRVGADIKELKGEMRDQHQQVLQAISTIGSNQK
jgi:hypothetical protein